MEIDDRKTRIIDLSLPIYDQAPAFPGDPPCRIRQKKFLAADGFNLAGLSFSSHQGTHLDAPFHFLEDGATLDAVDLSRCQGPALKADLTSHNLEREIDVADLEMLNLEIKPGDILLLATGWDKHYGQPEYFSAFPGMTMALADWLAAKKIKLLGLDMPNLNRGEDYSYIHRKLLQENILIVEGLANLDQIRANRFYFSALPLKVTGGDGSPVRAAAVEYL